jgi:hypothetical protein
MKVFIVKLLYTIVVVLILLPHLGSAQIVWKRSSGAVTFTKAPNADWTLAVNQDRISDSVWLTRASSQSLFNIRKEIEYRTGSPVGTRWAFGTTDSFSTLTYKTFVNLSGNNPRSLIGKDLVLHLVAQNVYLDLKFTAWGNGGAGANFSYSRATGILPVELTTFSAAVDRQGVTLSWKTATELNNAGFDVERRWVSASPSAQEKEWIRLGFMEGHGTVNSPMEYFYIDNSIGAGTYLYRLKQIDHDGVFTYSQTIEVTMAAPSLFALHQNYPNPFNPATTIGFTLEINGLTSLKIYDIVGREVAVLVNNELLEAGVYHQKQFDARNLASGVYYARLVSGAKVKMKKMSLMK